MLRRDFLSALPLLPVFAQGQGASTGGDPPSVYEWRQYTLRNGAGARRLDDYLQNALLPALNRLGHTPIGVFQVTFGLPTPTVFVLTPSTASGGADSLLARESKLDRDDTYSKAAAPYLDAVAADPVYVRQEVALLSAFPQFPHVSVPAATASKGPRIFELRTYESHNERAHRAKVKMFAEMGEIDIFRRTGLTPVFFSRTVAGSRVPSIVYMLVHENMAAREKSWSAFAGDPEWRKLAQTAGFTDPDIVTNITTVFLRPAAYSQI
jgi:NIPSNAP